MTTTVLLVDDHELIRQGLRRALERNGFRVVAEAGTVADARRQVGLTRPQVVVTDVNLPDGTGIDLARTLRQADESIGIVVLTMYAGDDTLFAALESGASAFVSKAAPSDDVVAAAKHAAVAPRSFTTRDLAGAMQRRADPRGPVLSPREEEILAMLADGMAVGPIARRLFISESTAKTHIARIYEKLGAANRAQAIMQAVRAGLLNPAADVTMPA